DSTTDALLVEIVPEDIQPIRPAEVVKAVAVGIADGRAGGCAQKRSPAQMLRHISTELERHAIRTGELQVGEAAGELARESCALAKARAICRCQRLEAGPPPCLNLLRRAIDVEEARLVVLVERHQRREPARQSRMAAERAVLGEIEIESSAQRRRRHRQNGAARSEQGKGRVHCYPRRTVYP